VFGCAQVILPLVRLARNRQSVSYAVLCNICTMAQERPDLFRVFLKDFFVNYFDSGFVRSLKLSILSAIATDTNITLILREFQGPDLNRTLIIYHVLSSV